MKKELPLSDITISPLSYVFRGKDSEILRLDPNGDIFVHGKLVENNKEVVNGMIDLLKQRTN